MMPGVFVDAYHINASLRPRSDGSVGGAYFTEGLEYRYWLTRGGWGSGQGRVCWVMLNPSMADAERDDATVRRCIGYTRDWGYAELVIVNLFALRATNPAALRLHAMPVGPSNNSHIRSAVETADLVVCGWGRHGSLMGRDFDVMQLLEPLTALHAVRLMKRPGKEVLGELEVLRSTGWDVPGHPLRLSAALRPVLFQARRVLAPRRDRG